MDSTICEGENVNVAEFFYMGGYAFYVWSAFSIVSIVLLANVIIPVCRRRQILRELTKQIEKQVSHESQA